MTPTVFPDNRVHVGGRDTTWRALAAEAPGNGESGRVARVVDTPLEAARAVAAAALLGRPLLLVERTRLTAGVQERLAADGFSLPGNPAAVPGPPAAPGTVWVLTSGTTGTPKLVIHTWSTLCTARPARTPPPRRWLCPYQTGTYAWYQLVTAALFQPGQTLVLPDRTDPESLFPAAAAAGIDSLSATPTFWRMACLRLSPAVLRAVPLTSISLGGEIVDQAILDTLAALYPAARLTHIYASTEAGACIVVSDGLAGFPAAVLTRNDPGTPRVEIGEGRLRICSPHTAAAAAGAPDTWLETGDLVEMRGERVHFVGRADRAMINVGGSKAWPADIEAVLLTHPAISWCRVRAVRAPFVGALPEADFVPVPGQPVPDETSLTAFCATRLPEYAVPRFWHALPEIPVQASLKSEA